MNTQPITAFRWVGGKWTLFPKLIPLIPDHKRYVSVFGGSGADIVRKSRSQEEVFNDIDCDVVTFFQVLQDAASRRGLCSRLLLTPYSRKQYRDCLAVLQSSEGDPIKRAWAFYVTTLVSYAAQAPCLATKGSFTINTKIVKSQRWKHVTSTLERIAARFRDVLLECRPWQQILERYDGPDSFFYLDPPYVWATRTSKAMYVHEMPDQEHVELLERIKHLQGKVMLSGYATPLYDEHLRTWQRRECDVVCSVASGKKKPRRTEVVWMNYKPHGR